MAQYVRIDSVENLDKTKDTMFVKILKPVLAVTLAAGLSTALAHTAGQSEDDHEARKKMAEEQEAKQSWNDFMQKVKSQSADKKQAAHESHGEH